MISGGVTWNSFRAQSPFQWTFPETSKNFLNKINYWGENLQEYTYVKNIKQPYIPNILAPPFFFLRYIRTQSIFSFLYLLSHERNFPLRSLMSFNSTYQPMAFVTMWLSLRTESLQNIAKVCKQNSMCSCTKLTGSPLMSEVKFTLKRKSVSFNEYFLHNRI
jgi:hypothetical protein